MENYKSIFSSVTFWAIMLSALSKIVMVFGFEMEASIHADIANLLAVYAPLGVGLVGDVVAIRGRMNAEQKVSFRRRNRRRPIT